MKNFYLITVVIMAFCITLCCFSNENEETQAATVNIKSIEDSTLKNLDIKIVQKEDIQLIGISIPTSFKMGQSKKDIPPFFHKTLYERTLDKVPNRINQNLMCVFLVKPNSPDFTYVIAAEVSSLDDVPEGMASYHLPAASYASVEVIKKGHDYVAPVFKYILEKWTAENGYIPAKQPGFIYYDDRFIPDYIKSGYSDNSIATIFIPVDKKEQ